MRPSPFEWTSCPRYLQKINAQPLDPDSEILTFGIEVIANQQQDIAVHHQQLETPCPQQILKTNKRSPPNSQTELQSLTNELSTQLSKQLPIAPADRSKALCGGLQNAQHRQLDDGCNNLVFASWIKCSSVPLLIYPDPENGTTTTSLVGAFNPTQDESASRKHQLGDSFMFTQTPQIET